MARKISHNLKSNINGDHTRIIEINECPFANIETRALDDIGEPTSTSKWTDKDPLPF